VYKKIGIQITVTDGDYCEEFTGDRSCCEYLSFPENGVPSCDAFEFRNLTEIKDYGVKKCELCLRSGTIKGNLEKENKLLRELLWLRHGCMEGLYGDDGELQCNKCMIDFKRDSPKTIKERWENFGKKKLTEFFMEEENETNKV